MKAFIAQSPNHAAFTDVPEPKVGPMDVLAKVSYAGICATDIAIITGKTTFVEQGLVKYPVRIGHEWSGVVAKVGSEVVNVKVGDHVVAEDYVPCFKCPECMDGNFAFCPNARSVGTVNCWDGCFAEYMLMPSQMVYKLRPETDLQEAAVIEPASIAMHGVRKSGATAGDTVLVFGTGPIGLSAVGLLKVMGARVILCGRRDSKLAYGRKMGADVLINSRTQNISEVLNQVTSRGKVNAIIETSGSVSVLHECADYVKSNGKVALVGFYEKKVDSFNIDKFVLNAIDLMGVAGTPHVTKKVIDLLENHQLSLKPLITSVYPFSQAEEAVEHVMENDGDRIKVLLEF